MPEFIMNGKESVNFKALPPFVQGYIEAAFFTEEEDIGSEKGFSDIPEDEVKKSLLDCYIFFETNCDDLNLLLRNGGPSGEYDEAAAGRDLWYTRNGHGVGYWDRGFTGEPGEAADRLADAANRMGPSEFYVTDDDDLAFTP